jgi:hypothetical protein
MNALTALNDLYKGDVVGHPFHGNQWTDSTSVNVITDKLDNVYASKEYKPDERMSQDLSHAKAKAYRLTLQGKFGDARKLFDSVGNVSQIHGMSSGARNNFRMASRLESIEEKIDRSMKKKEFEFKEDAVKYHLNNLKQDIDFMEVANMYVK